MQSNYLDISAGKIHYVSAGDAANDTIIFLHGFPEFWYSWRKQIEYFSKEFHVVAPDLRGYNKSFKPQKVDDYQVDKIANDVIEIIDHFGKEKVTVIGHDWGSIITWHLVSLYEHRFSKGVILNVPHPLAFKKKLTSSFQQLLKSWYIFFFQIPFLPAWAMGLNNFERPAKTLEETSVKGSFTQNDLEQYKIAWANENAMKYMIMWYKAAFRNPSQAKVYEGKKVTIPLKIIWGKNDLALVPEMAEESLEYCTLGDLSYLDNATHWVQQDRPDEVNRLIEKFL